MMTSKPAKLVGLQLLESERKTRATVYRIPGGGTLPASETSSDTGSNSGTIRPGSGTSGANDRTSAGSDATLKPAFSAALLTVQWMKRAPIELVDQVILDVCRDQFRTAQEIASMIKRSLAHVSNHYLPEPLKSGRLEPRYASRHHPDQAYRTRDKNAP